MQIIIIIIIKSQVSHCKSNGKSIHFIECSIALVSRTTKKCIQCLHNILRLTFVFVFMEFTTYLERKHLSTLFYFEGKLWKLWKWFNTCTNTSRLGDGYENPKVFDDNICLINNNSYLNNIYELYTKDGKASFAYYENLFKSGRHLFAFQM